jgi:hypothetical protein
LGLHRAGEVSSASKRKGDEWERTLVAYLRESGLDADRLRQTGTEDEGDIAVRFSAFQPSMILVIEAKAENRIDLPGYLRELQLEKSHYVKHRAMDPNRVDGVVVIKRRMASAGQAYVVTTVDDYFKIGQQ